MQSSAELQRNRFAQRLFAGLPARYDRLAELLSMGQNRRWRAMMVDQVVRGDPDLICDVASGTAGVALQLARRSKARVVGVDLSREMLSQGKSNVASHGFEQRIALTLGRAEQLPFSDASFSSLTFTYLLRYVEDPKETLRELARVVQPGGTVASLDFFVPPNLIWRCSWWCYTRLLLPLGGLLTGGVEWFRVGKFLGPNISSHYRRFSLDDTIEAWNHAGIEDVHVRLMSLGGGVVMWGTRSYA